MFIHLKPVFNTLIVAACLTVWCNCTKKPVHPEPEPVNKILSINLDKAYLGSDLVDSAFAIWELNGSQTQFLLEKSNEALTVNINKLQAGSGTLTVKIFSRVKFGVFYSSQWLFSQKASITPNNGIMVEGPKAFSDQQWKPRVELKDAIGHFAVIALRPDDPYFFVKDVPGNLQSIIVARDYWKAGGGVTHVGGGQWECSFGCVNDKGHVENTEFFSFLPAQMGSGTWNHVEIAVIYTEDQWGGGPVLSMTHTI
jgi:hypothetical protein